TPSKLNAQGVQEQVPTVNTFIRSHTDFDAAGDERVREVYDAISHRPRKRHGFRTPYEVHHSQTLHLL
ncbi:hypothetical protein PMM38_07890, partial [Bifidobacterium pseudocatenulatum]|nr:hypothetical protein [Bifidobacterium pseudocatenulatum]MDB6494203.1 hypothetical protein [Bifidobacterium pseudocatenulatum]MDB6504786.1 hypothetical protein [Bifidobacterium pseudocatenulatum]